jgi:hypothetical protein
LTVKEALVETPIVPMPDNVNKLEDGVETNSFL